MPQPFRFRWGRQAQNKPANVTFNVVDWDALLDIARDLSGDTQCIFEGDFHAGGRHIVRRILIPGNQSRWVARLPIISLSDINSNGGWWVGERQFTMLSEIATMKHIAKTTNIPVPEVFGYDCCLAANPAGLPYMLMSCIEGNMLADLGHEPDEHQRERLHRSILSIQFQLLKTSIDQIGRLTLDSSGNIDIGPLAAAFGFGGPFTLATDYFLSWANQGPKFKHYNMLTPDLQRATRSFPKRLESTIPKLDKYAGPPGRYPIIHPDFQMQNILLNDEFEVVGVIDWEYAYSAPASVFAARANMFLQFNATKATLEWNDEGAKYMVDIETIDKLDSADRLAPALTSPLAILGWCMQLFDEGRAVRFDQIVDRIEREL